jgi:hypothetical protein
LEALKRLRKHGAKYGTKADRQLDRKPKP